MSDDAAQLERAIALAVHAHLGQRYPSPDPEPYIVHLMRVTLAVDGARAQAVAVLHDVLEDTDATVRTLHDTGLPEDVVDAVVALTHRPEQTYEAYIEQVARNRLASEVKLADLADNLANNRRLPSTPDIEARIMRYERAVERLRRAIS
jgi:(p)ppGpp synthase/HD superfamily hydrolase